MLFRSRRSAPDAVRPVARAFARLSWPAFAVVTATGIWNIIDVSIGQLDTDYQVTAMLHIALAAITGIAAAVHSMGRSRLALALGGAVGLLTAFAALFVGVLLTTRG